MRNIDVFLKPVKNEPREGDLTTNLNSVESEKLSVQKSIPIMVNENCHRLSYDDG